MTPLAHADVATSTAESTAINHLQPKEDVYPVTALIPDSAGKNWFVTDFWRNSSTTKKYYFEGRVIVDPATGKVAAASDKANTIYDDLWTTYHVNVIDPETGETGYNVTEDDALANAAAAVQLPADYSLYEKGLRPGETQMYYVFDFVRYDQYSKKTYWGMRIVVDPYVGDVVGDPTVLKYFQARAIDVPEGFDPRTKELRAEKTTVTSDLKGIFTTPRYAIELAIFLLILVVLPFGLKKTGFKFPTGHALDLAFGLATALQIGLALYFVRYGGDQAVNAMWLFISAMGTVTSWVSARFFLQQTNALTSSDDLKIVSPSTLPTFADVGGMESVKQEIRDTVGILVNYGAKARAMGITFNGILLYGPPGVGKTFIARATAGEYKLNYIGVNVADMTSMYYSGSAKMIASVFKKAQKSSPCLLFFDEFDSVAQKRGENAVAMEDTRIVNQLLQQIESVRQMSGTIIVMAATNNKDKLDDAVIRPGRFDRHIMIPLPDLDARKLVIERILKGKPVSRNIDTAELAKISEGMSAAELGSAIEKAVFGILNMSIDTKDANLVITQENLVDAFRNLYAREKQTVKDIGWDDLILQDDTKNSLKRLVKLIENPALTEQLGIDAPRGALLYGPPGTGKTTLARVVASEAHTSFFSLSAADIFSKWLGESEQKIKSVFDEARKHRPSVIFIDEIDSVVRARGAVGDSAGREFENTTNQILQELDGIKDSSGLFVIGATNRPELIDPALTRGGRMSEKIEIPLPGEDERAKLFDLFLQKAQREGVMDTAALAKQTSGISGADIKMIVHQAILAAFDRGGKDGRVTLDDVLKAIEKHVMGPEQKSALIDPQARKIVAYHEAGHAFLAGTLPDAGGVHKITILSRGHALGYVTSESRGDRALQSRKYFLDIIAVKLGGYVAEKLVFGDITSGASSDLQAANAIAHDMVTQFGMSERLGPALATGEADAEAQKIIAESYKRAEEILAKNRKVLDAIVEALMQKETLDAPELKEIFAKYAVPAEAPTAAVAA